MPPDEVQQVKQSVSPPWLQQKSLHCQLIYKSAGVNGLVGTKYHALAATIVLMETTHNATMRHSNILFIQTTSFYILYEENIYTYRVGKSSIFSYVVDFRLYDVS